jgi:coenzyme F420-dependent glucose-6-phosphate dehydrogenase
MTTIGWKAGAEQFDPQTLLSAAVAAEEAGFDSVDISDHFAPWAEAGQAVFAWTWLGAAAGQTSRITLGTGLTCPILRYNPAIIAQAVATLECLAPGRVYLGVGTGEALNEFPVTGEWPEYNERQSRLAEAIYLIRELVTGEEVSFRGDYYQTHKARLWTRSDRPIPIYVSSLVPDSARFAGRHGDGLLTVGGQPPDHYRDLVSEFEAGARESGKDPSSMPRLIELNVAYSDDANTAVEEMRQYWAGTFVPALFNQKIYTPKDSETNGAAVGMDSIREKMCISSDPEEHIRFARRYTELGFTDLFFHSASPDQDRFVSAYGREVIQKIKSGDREPVGV